MGHLDELYQLLQSNKIEIDSIELAESLWLSKHISKTNSISPHDNKKTPTVDEKPSEEKNEPTEEQEEPLEDNSQVQQAKKQKRKDVPLHPVSDSENKSSLPFRTPLVRTLYKDNDLIFAFRHFRQKIASLKKNKLDEEKIADYFVKTEIFKPFYKKSYEKRFSVIFLIDSSESMKIWENLIAEFIQDVKSYHIFKKVTVYYLVTDSETPKLFKKKNLSSVVNAKWYKHVDANSIVFMFSDMTSKAWSSGILLEQVKQWQKYFPFAMVQMLPQRLWNGTKLIDASMGKMNTSKKFALNSKIASRAENILEKEEETLPELIKLPILNFNPSSIEAYGRVMRSLPNNKIEGALFETEDFVGEYQLEKKNTNLNAEQRLRAFYKYASKDAKALLELLAVVPLSLPIVKLVQQKLLPHSTQEHLSEVFMSSIIDKEQRVNGFYQFSKQENEEQGVREELIKKIGAKKAFQTIVHLSEVIQKQGGVFDFLAFVVNPDSLKVSDEFSEVDREFARISVSLLREMGEKYSSLAEKLVDCLEEVPNPEEEDISDLFNDSSILPLGYILNDRYIIINVLGKGGFGIVYKVRDIETQEVFAIKELFINRACFRRRDSLKVSSNNKKLFKYLKKKVYEEVNLLSSINHENILKEYGSFEENNTIYIVMEYIDGKSLQQITKFILSSFSSEKFSEVESKELLKQLIRGLKELYSKKIIHRDINPSNILKTKEGIYKLIDFNSLKYMSDSQIAITEIGTNKFIAPELVSEKAKVGVFTDIYSIGMTLVYILGKDQSENVTDIYMPSFTDRLLDNVDLAHARIASFNISDTFENILKKMIELKSEDRFQSLEEIEKALRYETLNIIEDNGFMYHNPLGIKETWEASKTYAKNLKLEGYNDWRLPSREEFKKISDDNRLEGVENEYFWTSEEKSRKKFCAWSVSISFPSEIWENKLGQNSVLCVREIFFLGSAK